MALTLEYEPAVVTPRLGLHRIPLRVQLMGALILLLALVVKIWIRVETTDQGYALSRERQSMVELDREQRDLTFQLATLMQHDNLRALASERLGMRPSNEQQVWKLRQ